MKKNKATILTLALILFVAIFLRTYHFHDWLYFKMDQARDSLLISQAIVDGAGNLPLLGPRAGATDVGVGFLRLGPAYYYFQYLSGKIFHSTSPDVFAYPDLFFSIAAIILIFFFLRLYFNNLISLLLVALYSFSFIIIQYSRFAWNPNSLQFFAILTFFGLLQFFRERNEKRKKWWLVLWAIGLFVGSQLHFFGFFMLLGASGLFILLKFQPWKKEKILQLKDRIFIGKIFTYALIILAVFVITYSPVIISDIKRNGENTKNFISALSSKPATKKKTFDESLQRGFDENMKNYCLITTSYCYSGKYKDGGVPIKFTTFLIVLGILLAGWKMKESSDQKQKDFLMLVLIWTGVFFILTVPVSYQIRPRFFIPVFLIPYIFIGLFFQLLQEKIKKGGVLIIIGATIILLNVNAEGTRAWFQEQAGAQNEDISTSRTLILKTKDGVTLGQLERVANYIYENKKIGANIYYYVKPEHIAPLKYLFRQKNDPSFVFLPLKMNDDPNAQYFAVVPSDVESQSYIESKFNSEIKILSEEQFGQLNVVEINIPNRAISQEFRFNQESSLSDRIFWSDVFGKKLNRDALQEEGIDSIE
ncbi:MAG: phospholipid carrier-dependent glycosyltransferase [Candidatus Moranbacteria bacterium]|jgi:4-amino-4-deoxy-L-arabinose transferase-like glycosyltransferase|nr:phospholipid carrier-dependent glycosyltransferase [Candidatus Moranbacteria bacterium]